MPRTWTVQCNGVHLHSVRPCRWLPKGKSLFYLKWRGWEFELTAHFRKGIAITAAWHLGKRYLGIAHAAHTWEMPSMAIKRREVSKSDVQHLAAVETTLFVQHLALLEHMCLRKYEDGSDRETGWITLKTAGAAWVVQVKDPDSGSSFSALADTIDKALDTAALLLACNEAPWELDAFLMRMKAEKKKK